MFQPDTPSRVLRRIEDLNQQSLPDLPGLPPSIDQTSFSEDDDGDSTVARSPPLNRKSPLGSSTIRASSPTPLDFSSPAPYTSTPAPSTLYHQRSQSTVVPSTSSTRYSGGNDTTATARPPPFRGSQVDSLRRGGGGGRRTPTQVYHDDDNTMMSEISKDRSIEGEEEDMVVLSGSGGEESDREPIIKDSIELSELPHAQVETQETTEDATEDQSTRDEDDSSLRQRQHHPLDLLGDLETIPESPARQKVKFDSTTFSRLRIRADCHLNRRFRLRNRSFPPHFRLSASGTSTPRFRLLNSVVALLLTSLLTA